MLQAASLFNQLLQHFPRTEFESLVKKHRAEHALRRSGIMVTRSLFGFGARALMVMVAGEGLEPP